MWKARGVQCRTPARRSSWPSPKEGLVLYISEMGIAKNAPDKDAAYAYLDALLDSQKSRNRLIDDMGLTTRRSTT